MPMRRFQTRLPKNNHGTGARELGHLHCFGAPGAGKTALLKAIIEQALADEQLAPPRAAQR